ncbi:MAG: glycine cleavage system aminomethyltransferase GcvT [Muribaculaceae bacterium]|nr:glycine cleavage system aminomethyltransferase GcvT [Muribaculaceae bacterium]
MTEEIKKTCLNDRHRSQGALMSPFAGYDMPIEYCGLDAEHVAVRTRAGLFDVSHMGEVDIDGKDAVRFVNHIFTGDAAAMKHGQALYGMMTNAQGGVVDDLLVYRKADQSYMLVINAANIDKDLEWIRMQSGGFDVEITDRCADFGQLALQGPDSEKIMKDVLGIDGSDLGFYTFKTLPGGAIVSRTGYTGEDGFEIYAAPGAIVEMWDRLMAAGVQPCGLGCRDTLRFEAGLPLYGDELTDTITPLEAGLGMFVKLDKPEGFIGCEALRRQKEEGLKRKLVGLEIEGGATARHGFEVLDLEGAVVGEITTGYNSISVGKNIAMALVDTRYGALGTKLLVKIRRRTVPATVVKKRFYTPNYKK